MNAATPSPAPLAGPSGSQHLPALDGVRGLAILLVLFHHLTVFEPVSAAGRCFASVMEFAGHGVDLFFVLSGFLIVRQLSAHRESAGFAARFWLRRGAKIAPLYLAVTFLVFVALEPLLQASHHQEKLRWLLAGEDQWPWYVFFLSNVRKALDARFTNPALDVAWSLAVEVQFYLLAFVAARLLAPSRWKTLAVVAIAAATLFRLGLMLARAAWVPILVLTPGRLDAFAWGALAAIAPAWLAWAPPVLPWLVLLLPLLVPWSRDTAGVEIAGYGLVALAGGILVWRASLPGPSRFRRWLGGPALSLLGRISYSVYLTHLPLRAFLRDRFLPAPRLLDSPSAWLVQGAFFLGAGLACVLAGWLTWRCFEEPIRRFVLARLEPNLVAPVRQAT
jgi:peptidoglycan/LPS O-acetylase OafA/YrhL